VSDSAEFGSWFGVHFEGPFVPHEPLIGKIVPTTADPEIAKSQKPYEGTPFEIVVDRIEPQRLFSFRWHPYAVDKSVDYATETPTLVVFELEEVASGTQLTITESGFDAIPVARRAKAFTMNEGGWSAQMKLIEKHLDHAL
jgi:uncharacterized protein YndB with AHSA1/START domain